MYDKAIVVDYNKDKSRFELTVPFMYNGVAQGLPSRKWNKPARKWFAPVIRKNAEHISRTIATMSSTTVTPDAAEAIATCLERAHKRITEKFPDWYKPVLPYRSYQQQALDQLYSMPCGALFMCVGSGKTKTTIDLVAARAMASGDLNVDALVVACPFSIRQNWLKQLKEHCPIAYEAVVLDFKTKKGRDDYARVMAADDRLRIIIVGIESLSTGGAIEKVGNFLLHTRAAFVVDESSRIKNPSAKRTKNIVALGNRAKYKLILTGTPITQGLIDLYAQMEFLSPDIIGVGDFYSFRNRYAIMGGFDNKEIIGYKNAEELLGSIMPYTFQITAEEALSELPEKTYMTRMVSMSAEQKKVYKGISSEKMIETSSETIAIQNALEKLMRLQQVTGGFTIDKKVDPVSGKEETVPVPLQSAKVQEVLNIAEEDEASTIVWCRFRAEIAAVADALRAKYGRDAVVEFHGGVTSEQRWKNVCDFESKKARFFVGNQVSGGVGLELVAATVVVYYSNTFSYEDRVQSEARNHRIGQKNPVTYIDLVCEGTIDTHVIDVVKEKGNMASFVRDVIRGGGISNGSMQVNAIENAINCFGLDGY